MDNFLYHPELNPVLLFDVAKTNLAIYNSSKHFEDFSFEKRGHGWLQVADNKQIWQTTDIIRLQFESTFDPITIELLNRYEYPVITLPALIGIANEGIANAYSFEVEIALTGLPPGCYKIRRTADTQIHESKWMYISDELIPESIMMEYYHSSYHKDVIFETGIKFQYRTYGWIDFDKLEKPRKDEYYRDQKFNSSLLTSLSSKQFPVHFGNEDGLTSDEFNLIDEIWSCDNVMIDGKPYALSGESKFEFERVDKYRKFGVKTLIEPGINRKSRVFTFATNPNQKIMSQILVDAKVFGDVSNQGSSNAVPVINIE